MIFKKNVSCKLDHHFIITLFLLVYHPVEANTIELTVSS